MAFLMRSFNRLTSSQRGEAFNPLSWPFLLATFAYGVGFSLFFPFNDWLGSSSVYDAMESVGPLLPLLWGVVALLNIVMGATFLIFNIPPFGKVSGLIGFALWLFVGICYVFSKDWMVLFGVALPNMWFWVWQYLSLSVFRKQDADDKEILAAYHRGEYDDDNGGQALRERNRGKDLQFEGQYVNPDDGGDSSRSLDKPE